MVARRGRSEGAARQHALPADACPYPRPFPPDFHDCPAYHPRHFVALTTGYDPMSPVWTCANLVVAPVPGAPLRFYPRCRIGDAEARVAWAEGEHAKRLGLLRGLSRELTRATGSVTTELVAAKGAQLQAAAGSPDREAATRRLRAVARAWLAGLDTFMERQGRVLRSIGFPPEAVRTLCSDLLTDYVDQSGAAPPEISDEALRLFPEDVRVLLRPGDDPPQERASAQ
jgi:hypothetical protein